MPRDGTGNYTQPYPDVVTQTTIASAVYNGFTHDVSADLNAARPIVAGGTGATNASAARVNLKTEVAMQTVANFDSQIWESGSFTAPASTPGAPTANPQMGSVQVADANNITVKSTDRTTGITYSRMKTSGTWGNWSADSGSGAFVLKAGDTMTGNLTIAKATPNIILSASAAVDSNDIYAATGGTPRWILRMNNTDYNVYRYNDSGIGIDYPFSISRATGLISMPNGIATNLTISKTSPSITMSSPTAVDNNDVIAYTGGVVRWLMRMSNTDFNFYRFDDAGTVVDIPFSINRATGRISATKGTDAFVVGTQALSATPAALAIGYTSSSQVGISLRPVADGFASIYFNNAGGGAIGSISLTNVATAYNTSSDERLKEDLKSFDAGNIIDDTMVYDFRWKDTSERAFGVIAQQAVNVYDKPVFHDEKADRWFVDYSKYVPVILQELKTLRARVAELEGRPSTQPA